MPVALGLAAGLLGGATATLAGPAPVPAVGEATLVIGQARLTGADGMSRPMHRGAGLRPGDRVETETGAHVHVRFADGGLVSVRPGSRLVVEQYAVASPGASGAIKFRLEEGVVRSVTGAWGEAARERFRLNTPVAAIGVKGTDFVVRSSGEATAASVFTGAIVVAPLTEACAATLGPCANGQELLLSADMKGQMLELRRDQPAPRLVPAVDLLALAHTGRESGSASAARSSTGVGAGAVEITLAGPVTKPEGSGRAVAEALAVEALAAAGRSDAMPQPAPDPTQQLHWTRHTWAAALAGDDFTRRFDLALIQGTRSLATDGAFSLRRPEATAFAPREGKASFRLSQSAAGVVRDAGRRLEDVQITRGTLEVDFTRSAFATDITATGPVLGAAVVQATGTIDAVGAMRSSAGNAFVAGGFNGNGEEAGLLFRREVPGGILQGVTLWGR